MEYRIKIQQIKSLYLQGQISFEQAQEQIEPLLVTMNTRGEKIAREHGMKFTKLTFGYVFR